MRARPVSDKTSRPAEVPPAEAPRCVNCSFYVGRHASQEMLDRAEAAGHPAPPGHCCRFPQRVSKHPEDVCGEHPEIAKRRTAYLARALAAAVADLPVP